MAGAYYHNEALRKTRVLERKAEALKNMMDQGGSFGQMSNNMHQVKGYQQAPIVFSEQGHYEQNRVKLEKFRVNSAGFDNRYRHRDDLNPHCDLAHAVVYPGKDNSDYTNDENRNNRRLNKYTEQYEIARKINGEFHVQVCKETQEMAEFSNFPQEQNGCRKFKRRPKEDVIRKPTPESVKKIQRDQVYHILHPAKLNYYKTGPTREMRQYDHSRTGPVVDKSNYELRREFNFLGNSLSMLKSDIAPAHKPIPMCRRF